MNFIQCARNSTEQNLKLTQINTSLYFVATRDIGIGEELLVWYDEVQYGVYMGLPTGFGEIRGPFVETTAMEPGKDVCTANSSWLNVCILWLSSSSHPGVILQSFTVYLMELIF